MYNVYSYDLRIYGPHIYKPCYDANFNTFPLPNAKTNENKPPNASSHIY